VERLVKFEHHKDKIEEINPSLNNMEMNSVVYLITPICNPAGNSNQVKAEIHSLANLANMRVREPKLLTTRYVKAKWV
jgi:hypothetical protein